MKRIFCFLLLCILFVGSPRNTLANFTDINEWTAASENSTSEIDFAFFNESGYIEKSLTGNVTFEVTLKNTSSLQKDFCPIFSVYDSNGKLKEVKMGQQTAVPADSTKTSLVTLQMGWVLPTDTVKAMAWDRTNLCPYADAQILSGMEADFYGNDFNSATLLSDINRQVNGAIHTNGDTDYLRFYAPGSGAYVLKCFSGSGAKASLYDASQNALESNFTSYRGTLTAGAVYYIKIEQESGVGEYLCSIGLADQVQDFDVYQFDVDVNTHKQEILTICEELYAANREAAKTMYKDYETVLAADARLHELPEFLKGHPKDLANFDTLLNQYYATKYTDFQDVKQQYMEIITGYDGEDGYQSPGDVGSTLGSRKAHPPYLPLPDGESATDLLAETVETPSLTITAKTSTSLTYHVVFPISGAQQNAICLVDFNTDDGLTAYINPYEGNESSGDHLARPSGTFTIDGLVPGGVYILQAAWAVGLWDTFTIYRRVQLPYDTPESKKVYAGTHVTARIEDADKAEISNSHLNTWLSRMDSVYNALKDLTGYLPYGGRKIEINSSREDLSESAGMPDGMDYWEIIYGWSGNPITLSQPHYRSLLRRLPSGDWGDTAIHELSHDFDYYGWEFDPEVLAFFKTYYVVEQLNATVYRSDVGYDGDNIDPYPWYTGSDYYRFLKHDCYLGYDDYFNKGSYGSGGMAAILVEIKNTIGWEPFRRTFRYFTDLSSSQIPASDGGKLQLFLTKLKDFSGEDVLSLISTRDKGIIEDWFGVSMEYIDPVYPDAGGAASSGGGAEIDVPSGNYITYTFTPEESAVYYIYTSPYAGSGVSNDTYLEVYTTPNLTGTPIASNDDYDGSRFSKVSVSMTEGVTYYIKVRHYQNGQVHAQLNVTRNVPVQPLSLDGYEDIITANGEYAMYSFTPDTSQMYTFHVSSYNGGTSSYDTYIKLYTSENMTNRIGYHNDKIIANLTAGQTYYLQYSGFLYKYSRGRVGVKAAQTVEFKKRTDGNFIYVNSPEYITNRDIVDADEYYSENEERLKIFEETNISGKNTFYEPHISWFGVSGQEAFYPKQQFYMDVDFYNPTDQTITVSIENLAYGTQYAVLQQYFNGGYNYDITIEPYSHVPILSHIGAPLLCQEIGEGEWVRIAVMLFDFTVHNGAITVSTIAAYNPANLYLRDGTENIVDATGAALDNGEVIYNLNSRLNESDLYGKMKGIARNQAGWIDAEIDLVIDDSTSLGEPLPIYLKDDFYTYGIANPKRSWISALSPLSDRWNGVLMALPNGLHNFTYHFKETNRLWHFDFEHRDLRYVDIDGSRASVNDPVSEEVKEYARLDMAAGRKEHFGSEEAPDEYAMSMGQWGATYHYTVTINNTTGSDRIAYVKTQSAENLIFGVKEQGESSYTTQYYAKINNDSENPENTAVIPIPKNEMITFEFVTLLGGGLGGLNHSIVIE